MSCFGFYVVPFMILSIISFGLFKKVNVFDSFLSGASQGFSSVVSLIPSMVGLVVAVKMLQSSGALDILISFISSFCKYFGFPAQVVPMAVLRSISGSGSIAILDNILKNHGADSFIGRLASIISGSTETTFYALAIYFGSVKIKNSKYAAVCALIADSMSVIMSFITLKYFFS